MNIVPNKRTFISKKQLIPIEYRLFVLQSVTARPLSHFGAQTTVSAFQFNTSATGLQTVRTDTTKTRGFASPTLPMPSDSSLREGQFSLEAEVDGLAKGTSSAKTLRDVFGIDEC